MAVNTRMLEIDSSGTISTNDDLKLTKREAMRRSCNLKHAAGTHLVVPPVCTRSYLFTALQVVSPAEEVGAQVSEILGCRIIKADDKQRPVDDLETAGIVPIFLK